MGVYEFTETVSCFMRVTWAAAAGRLHLLGSSQPIIESTTGLYTCGKSRQSSTGKFYLCLIYDQLAYSSFASKHYKS